MTCVLPPWGTPSCTHKKVEESHHVIMLVVTTKLPVAVVAQSSLDRNEGESVTLSSHFLRPPVLTLTARFSPRSRTRLRVARRDRRSLPLAGSRPHGHPSLPPDFFQLRVLPAKDGGWRREPLGEDGDDGGPPGALPPRLRSHRQPLQRSKSEDHHLCTRRSPALRAAAAVRCAALPAPPASRPFPPSFARLRSPLS